MDELRAQLRRHAFGVWRHRWVAVALAWAICAGGWAWVMSIPNSYEANARLYVDADAVLTPLLQGLALDNSLLSQIEVLQRTLLSRPNLEKLISKTDLELTITGPADEERLVAALGRNIIVTPQTRNLFTITYRNANPRLAYDVVQSILNIFIESKTGNNRADLENARQFLAQQIGGYETQLRDAEKKRAEFRAKYIDLLPGDSGTSRLDAARINATALQGQLADVVARRDRLAEELAATPPTLVVETDPGTPAGGGGGGGGDVAAAQRRLDEMLLTLTDQHPDVIRQRHLIEQLRKSGGGSGSGGVVIPARPARSKVQPNAVYDQLKVLQVQAESDVASLQRQVKDAVRERDRLEDIARNAPGVEAQYINLDRDYDVVRKNYDELVARRESMRLSAAADTDADKVKLQIVDPPQIPQIPITQRRELLLSGVLLAGLGGGVAAALLLGQLDQSFHTIRDLRDLGAPIAGAISLVPILPRPRMIVAPILRVGFAVLLLIAAYGGIVYRLVYRAVA